MILRHGARREAIGFLGFLRIRARDSVRESRIGSAYRAPQVALRSPEMIPRGILAYTYTHTHIYIYIYVYMHVYIHIYPACPRGSERVLRARQVGYCLLSIVICIIYMSITYTYKVVFNLQV